MNRLKSNNVFRSNDLSQDLAGKSVISGISTMGSQVVQFFLRISGTMVLARLLAPADYGIIGMAAVVVNLAAMFKDAGLSMATVQRDEITHEQISTLFWINGIISFVIGICISFASPLVAAFYGKSELIAVTVALSISFIITGLSIQHTALLRRHMHFGNLAFIKIITQVTTLTVTIFLAIFNWGYWALVGGSLASAFITVFLTFFFCPWIPGRIYRGSGVRCMLKFGGHLTGFNFLNYFSRNADNILIGRFIGADALGLYAKAYQLFMLPISQVRGSLTQVAMPMLSSLQNQPERYLKYYQRLLDIMATITIPLTMYCVIEADFLIRFILGPQWLEVIPVFRILAMGSFIQAVAGTRGLVLISHGFSKRYLYWGGFNAIICVLSFVIGIPYGIKGVAAAYVIANYTILIPSLFYCFHKTPVTVSLFMKTLILPMLSSCAAGLAIIILLYIWPNDTFIVHGLCLVLFVLIYGGLSLCRKSVRETGGMIFNKFSKNNGAQPAHLS